LAQLQIANRDYECSKFEFCL